MGHPTLLEAMYRAGTDRLAPLLDELRAAGYDAEIRADVRDLPEDCQKHTLSLVITFPTVVYMDRPSTRRACAACTERAGRGPMARPITHGVGEPCPSNAELA